MLTYLRRHHIALVALFLALGGTAYAASLPRNSVGPSQLRNNAVTSAKVKNRSLLARDFKRGQLPRGATGRTGPAGSAGARGAIGPQGQRGPSDAYRDFFEDRPISTGNWGDAAVLDLPAGNYLVTANAYLENTGTAEQTVVSVLAPLSYMGGSFANYGGDGARITLPASGAAAHTATLAVTLDQPGTMHFAFMPESPDGHQTPTVNVKDIDIGAIQVGHFND